MTTAIIDRWRLAMDVTQVMYMGYLDPRATPGEKIFCRVRSVIWQDHITAGPDDDDPWRYECAAQIF